MIYREISGIRMSAVCMGCWNISGDTTWGSQDEKDSEAAIKAALTEGINFFDTAEAYGNGHSEEILGKVLSARRKETVIATKTARLNPRSLKKACESSMKRLRTDYIDVFYLHWPDAAIPLEDSAGALYELQKEGKIRLPAVSNFGPAHLSAMLEHMPVQLNQVAYNLLFRAAEYDIFRACADNDVFPAAYSPLAEGLLTGKFEHPDGVPEGRARTRHFSGKRPMARHGGGGFEEETFRVIGEIKKIAAELSVSPAELSLRWVLEKGCGFAVAGARNAAQARMNAKAAGLELPGDFAGKLDEATSGLKEAMGQNPDMWQDDSRIS